jgi:hypothetical protein
MFHHEPLIKKLYFNRQESSLLRAISSDHKIENEAATPSTSNRPEKIFL